MTGKPLTGDDVAFGCFFGSGAIALTLGIASVIPANLNTTAAIGFFIAIPLAMLALLLMAVAVIYTLFFHRHKSLMTLSAISLLLAIEMAGEYGPNTLYNVSPVVYGIVTIAITASWFISSRKR